MTVTTAARTSDEVQRQQAIDPSRSFIVEAPAGSGKTSLLVQRFLRLLSLVKRPECAVAMTFTRKAAAEMRERVLSLLEAADREKPLESEHEEFTRELARSVLRNSRDCGWNLLEHSGRLQIQTIDSFCNMLVRQMPITAGLGGMANVTDDANNLYRRAAHQALQSLTAGDEQTRALFRRIASHFDNNMARLETQIVRMLAKRDQWRVRSGQSNDELLGDFYGLYHHACEALTAVFREHGAVDFCEVTEAAITALGTPENPTDLLYWLDYRIEHLLVDEFQDTSFAQYRLLQALTEQWSDGDGHTLFLVGDPMQSIYRFREADVALFLKCCARQQLGSVRLTRLSLTSNFRSTPEVVTWTQQTFAPIMQEDNPSTGAVKLRPVVAARPASSSTPQLIALVGDNGNGEAEAIVEILRRAPVRKEVAVLVRSRSQVAAILPALRKAGISYEAIDFDCLREEQHILDLVSLTKALLHVGDRLSWLACLRAPWCGLTLKDLATLAENEDRTIFELLADPDKVVALSSDGRCRAVRVGEILSAALEQAGRIPLRDLVEKTWLALGGPAVLASQDQCDDVDAFLSVIERCEQGGTIRDFALLDGRLQCLWAKPAKVEDPVQILTIHNAKGLEFKTVILPKLGARTAPPDRDVVVWTDGLVAAKPQSGASSEVYENICRQLGEQEAHELKRLFYVAVTRAKDELYLLGNANPKKNGEFGSINKNTFLGLIWDAVKGQFESRQRLVPASKVEKPTGRPSIRRLPADWSSPKLEHSVRWEPAYEQKAASDQELSYKWVNDTGRHVGTIVHKLLKRMAAHPAPIHGLESLVQSELVRLGVQKTDRNSAAERVLRSIGNAASSERGRWILAPHAEARSEWALQGLLNGTLLSGVVDRAFRDDNGRFWIIDFKTSDHQGSDLKSFLRQEEKHYRPQLEAYAALISQLLPGPFSLGLYFPLLNEWREWAFAEETTLAAGHYTES